ncbi:predicted protein [Plenodomus lingam JN3]|uniref:Predicted protein n=1 Tax=Leptosphaeria maculans (strain JN3 / isolate v23.1.3 / race Av1-4-5-6-7-8) TaxID=985895 RepID=E5ABP2_LEPMJ|nr:predicted protein [Plenodomus lingam JN3]CBY01083.1 predicted protein [Plenodomus lingam JN3]
MHIPHRSRRAHGAERAHEAKFFIFEIKANIRLAAVL